MEDTMGMWWPSYNFKYCTRDDIALKQSFEIIKTKTTIHIIHIILAASLVYQPFCLLQTIAHILLLHPHLHCQIYPHTD